MTLQEILKKEEGKFTYPVHIDYRTMAPGNNDIYVGGCTVTRSMELIPYDNDSYSLNDVFIDYALETSMSGEIYFSCWYKSVWIR